VTEATLAAFVLIEVFGVDVAFAAFLKSVKTHVDLAARYQRGDLRVCPAGDGEGPRDVLGRRTSKLCVAFLRRVLHWREKVALRVEVETAGSFVLVGS
jgi:hypothetical protein